MSQVYELTGVKMGNPFWLTEEQMDRLVSEGGEEKVVMIDATYLKALRMASSLRAKRKHSAAYPRLLNFRSGSYAKAGG